MIFPEKNDREVKQLFGNIFGRNSSFFIAPKRVNYVNYSASGFGNLKLTPLKPTSVHPEGRP